MSQRGRYGSKIMPGQSMSGKYPGFIDCGGGIFRRPAVWITKAGNERSSNYYYVEIACANCSKITLATKANVGRTRIFCSDDCKKTKRQSENSGRRVLRKRDLGHHVLVKTYNHPRTNRANQVYEHVLVAEQKVGRPISGDERVHHINCIKHDNRPENLFVCANNTEHLKIHGSLNACVDELILIGALIFDEASKTYQVRK